MKAFLAAALNALLTATPAYPPGSVSVVYEAHANWTVSPFVLIVSVPAKGALTILAVDIRSSTSPRREQPTLRRELMQDWFSNVWMDGHLPISAKQLTP